jgi:hypothetical protein
MAISHSDSATGDGKGRQPVPSARRAWAVGVLTAFFFFSLAAAPLQAGAAGLAPGLLPGDAIHLGQLEQVRAGAGDVARIAYSGTAMAVALSGACVPTLYPGEKTVGLAMGTYKSYAAASLGFKALSDDGRMAWGMAVASTGNDWGLNAGIGWKLPRAGGQ